MTDRSTLTKDTVGVVPKINPILYTFTPTWCRYSLTETPTQRAMTIVPHTDDFIYVIVDGRLLQTASQKYAVNEDKDQSPTHGDD